MSSKFKFKFIYLSKKAKFRERVGVWVKGLANWRVAL